MCEVSERIFAQGVKDGRKLAIERGIERGRLQEKRIIARKLQQRGNNIAEIADFLEVSEKQVEEWLSLQMA
ncbi:MAG: hypothetical protein LUE24_11340 [Lachnospiraceae bacterium]|nr:hypothetical protein [Lachnospiraceae bacterium]